MSVSPADPRVYFLLRRAADLLLTVLTKRQVSGLENVPEPGPYLVVANHLSSVDPAFLLATLPVQVTVLAAQTHRNDFLVGELLVKLGAIWIRRGEVDRKALRTALEVLEAGDIVGIAPEGTRSRAGGLQAGKIGAAYLATRADVPLLPVVITGTENVFLELKRLRRATLTAAIGKPFRLPASGRLPLADLQIYTDQIMRVLAEMLPEKYRGVYK